MLLFYIPAILGTLFLHQFHLYCVEAQVLSYTDPLPAYYGTKTYGNDDCTESPYEGAGYAIGICKVDSPESSMQLCNVTTCVYYTWTDSISCSGAPNDTYYEPMSTVCTPSISTPGVSSVPAVFPGATPWLDVGTAWVSLEMANETTCSGDISYFSATQMGYCTSTFLFVDCEGFSGLFSDACVDGSNYFQSASNCTYTNVKYYCFSANDGNDDGGGGSTSSGGGGVTLSTGAVVGVSLFAVCFCLGIFLALLAFFAPAQFAKISAVLLGRSSNSSDINTKLVGSEVRKSEINMA
jgi:hypothetical protein